MIESQSKIHYRRKIEELNLLYDVSQTLDRSLDLNQIIQPVLKALSDRLGLFRSTVTLFNRQSEKIQIEAAHGMTNREKERGEYLLGEGVIGRVIEAGEPVMVPNITDSSEFLDKTETRKKYTNNNLAYICVPIKIENITIGALSADKLNNVSISSPSNELDEDMKLLSIIGSMIAGAVKTRRKVQEEQEKQLSNNPQFKPIDIIGTSTSMVEVYDLIKQVASSDATVLIRGESGTGKELIAHAIQRNSLRNKKPFIKVNCAALTETIIESELFGHEKGAFTSAVSKRIGRFELANDGTIFLDEIGDLSPSTQVKLLRVLQEKEFERVGGTTTIKVNVRIIAATNRPLENMMEENLFREDLYYRLNVFPIHLPLLKDRRSDIMLLADHFTEKYGKSASKPIKRISTPAIELFMSYHWPGNIRELENCIERAVLLSTDGVIHGHHLPPSLQSAESTGTELHETLKTAVEKLEKELIFDSLKTSKGNKAKAARQLGLTERKMGLRVDKYGIDTGIFAT
ncbi:MAG: sigma 54-interacting transcriptional regulator [Spirochaetia bacterium]|jgi:Nif-specific regulatory protein|nr:sigma 54-interacting transcriptional regulator [Spirochaetia bacterium]